MNNPVKMAIVGYGGMGSWHGDKLKSVPEMEVLGTFDILENRQEKARGDGYKTYGSFAEVLSDKQLEFVTIATPNDLHRPLAVELMNAGKHVLCEKPVTMSSADLEAMIAASEKNGVFFTTHQNRRWDEDYRVAKQIVNERKLGDTFLIESRVHGSRGIPSDWRNMKERGGGMVLDWGVHLLDQMLMLDENNKVASVYAELTHITNDSVDDGFRALLTFEDGFRALVEVGTSNFIILPRWYILGENGTAVIENFNLDGKITMISDWETRDKVSAIFDWTRHDAAPIITAAGLTKTMAPRSADTIKDYPLPRIDSDIRDFYRNVNDVVRTGAAPCVNHKQMRRVVKLMEAVFRSGETNTVIKEII